MSEESLAKRAKVGEHESGDSLAKPDFRIVVENETFEVHSLILAMVSPVFRMMLAADMSEKERKEVLLPDKSAKEFRTFYSMIQPLTTTKVTAENAVFLSRWATEYQIDTLKTSCEEFMLAKMPVDVSSLQHASLYGLSRRLQQCVSEISKNVPTHLKELEAAMPNLSEDLLQRLWPALCSAAGVKKFNMPSLGTIRVMFPFIAAAARASNHHSLCSEIEAWPNTAAFQISRATQAGAWIQSKILDLKSKGLFP